MRTRSTIEYIHEGQFVVEIEVTLIETDSEWSPHYPIEDVRRLEYAREALHRGDLRAAAQLGRVSS
jgi:hypothetical protein